MAGNNIGFNADVAPISEDLRALDLRMDIQKGLEKMLTLDGPLDNQALVVDMGDWLMKTTTGFNAPPTGNAVPHVFPVITGNQQYDGLATGGVTVVIGGGIVYLTNKFVPGSYTIGQNLCVKSLSAGTEQDLWPSAAGSNDAVVARVLAYDSVKLTMLIQVLNR